DLQLPQPTPIVPCRTPQGVLSPKNPAPYLVAPVNIPMKRPHIYRDHMRGVLTDDGRFAPGVTSILKRGLPTPEPLARWKYTNPDAEEITERAATRGTALHAAVESWLKGEAADATHLGAAAIHAVDEFATVFWDP